MYSRNQHIHHLWHVLQPCMQLWCYFSAVVSINLVLLLYWFCRLYWPKNALDKCRGLQRKWVYVGREHVMLHCYSRRCLKKSGTCRIISLLAGVVVLEYSGPSLYVAVSQRPVMLRLWGWTHHLLSFGMCVNVNVSPHTVCVSASIPPDGSFLCTPLTVASTMMPHSFFVPRAVYSRTLSTSALYVAWSWYVRKPRAYIPCCPAPPWSQDVVVNSRRWIIPWMPVHVVPWNKVTVWWSLCGMYSFLGPNPCSGIL